MGRDSAMQATILALDEPRHGRTPRPGTTDGHDPVGLLGVLAAGGLMGTLGPIAAIAYAEGLSPPALSGLRAAIGAAILALLVLSRRTPSVHLARLPRRQRAILLLAIFVNGLMNLALFVAFGAMAVGLVMLVYYAYPAIVAGLSVALGRERLTVVRGLALAAAAVGVALVLGGQVGPETNATLAGVALAGLAATLHAIYLVAIKSGFDDVPAIQATSLVLAGGVLISGSAAIAIGGAGVLGPWLASPVAWLAITFAGTFGALPKAWIIGGVRRIGSTAAAFALLIEPLVAVGVAAVVLGQRLTVTELVGGGAILVAVVLAQRPGRKAPRPAAVAPG